MPCGLQDSEHVLWVETRFGWVETRLGGESHGFTQGAAIGKREPTTIDNDLNGELCWQSDFSGGQLLTHGRGLIGWPDCGAGLVDWKAIVGMSELQA